MELATVKGDSVMMFYHPHDGVAEVGEQFSLLEMPEGKSGLVVQVVANELIEFDGLAQGMIQRLLEARYADTHVLLNHEDAGGGMDEVRNIKIARAKIRKRIVQGEWVSWDGYVPTRNVRIERIDACELLPRVLPTPASGASLDSLFSSDGIPCVMNGPNLGHVCAIIGMKGKGKSHLTKLMVLALAEKRIPMMVFDINHEYENLPRARVLCWKQNFLFSLSELGDSVIVTLVRAMNPMTDTAGATFEHKLDEFFKERRDKCREQNERFTIDVPYIKGQFANIRMHESVGQAIADRLDQLDDLFLREVDVTHEEKENAKDSMLRPLYEAACTGEPIVFDLAGLSSVLRRALTTAVIGVVEKICDTEKRRRTNRFPYVIFDEAHLYLSEDTLLGVVTRVRHTGIGCFVVSNTPQKLPSDVFRQLDNLFLLGLGHDKDVRAVAETSITDAETVDYFANRLPQHHALVVGSLTNEYPLVVKVLPLPHGVPASGVTRSPWDRLL